ncbi:MAG: PKD domain-containing protein [Bacteroidia bacterium]
MRALVNKVIITLLVNFALMSILNNRLSAQNGCPNADFSQNNFNNWQGFTGNYNNPAQNTGIVNGRHTIMTGPGTDPNSCGGLPLVPPGSTFSARLGNANYGAEAERLRYTLTVDPSNVFFTYKYAVVFEQAGHSPADQPKFDLRILNSANQVINPTCGQYSVYEGQPGSNYVNCSYYRYQNWRTVGLDLSPYMGQTITIEFTTYDCALGGHFGYAYVAASCGPLELDVSYCPGSNSAILEAPAGFATYNWSTGQTGQTITINNPNVGQNVTVTMTSVVSPSCQVTLNTLLQPTTVDAHFNFTSGCVYDTFNFTDSTIVNNSSVSTWSWNFGDPGSGANNTSNLQNPTHVFSTAGTFNVTLIALVPAGCGDTITRQVVVQPQPTPAFNAPAVCFGVAANFTDQSISNTSNPISSWNWDFGDGNTSTAQNPSNTYTSPGNYNVTLIVSNDLGCLDTLQQQITVYNVPQADFNFTSQCDGTAIPFTDASTTPAPTTINSWQWNFGNNTSTSQNPTNVFPSNGTFNVQLIVGASTGCYDTITKPVRVYANPSAGFSYTDVCLGNVMSLTDSSSIATTDTIVSYLWAFGDGSPTDNNQNTTHLYNNAGAYTVTLIVTGTGGCSDVQTHTVNVYDAPQANFTTSNVCLNTAASFTNTTVSPQHGGMGNFSWNFGDGSPLNTNDWNANHQYTTHGTYQVTLITQNSNLGCADTITLPIIIHPMPVPNFTFVNQCQADAYTFTNTSSIAQGTIASYNWNFGDNSTSTASSPSHTYSSSGNYSVTLTATSDSGCVASITQQVTVYPMPNADFTVNEVCHNSPTEFTSTSSVLPPDNITTYQWLFGDNNSSSQQNPQHTYSSAGLYNATLIVTTNHNCSDTIVLPVTVNPNPVVDFVANKINGCSPLCIDFTQQATISSGVNSQYIWNFGDGNNGNGAVVSNCYTNTTIYNPISRDITLTVVSDKGCSTTVTKPNYITVYPLPVAEFTPIPKETSILDPIIYFENQSLGSNAWLWHFGEANNTGDTISQNPYHTYKDTGIYQVTLISTNQWGCKDTVVHDVVIIGDFAYFIPNTFTPNGDGVNDSFYGKGYGIKEIVFQVFDRWGLLLFETTDVNEGWKGTYQGENCQQDVYVYQVRIVDIFDRKHQYRGHVNLIR